jgi:hypothetical protein
VIRDEKDVSDGLEYIIGNPSKRWRMSKIITGFGQRRFAKKAPARRTALQNSDSAVLT